MSYTLKTQLNNTDVSDFLDTIQDDSKKEEAFKLLELFQKVSKEDAKMWGTTIVGFGTYSYTNSTGKPYTWMRTAFAPRAGGFSIYIMPGYDMGMEDLFASLGKYKMGKSCLTIKKLSDIDINILEKIIAQSLVIMADKYPII